ncbi:BRCA1-associated ATM activator 1 isoform X1 [Arapaima gigas]
MQSVSAGSRTRICNELQVNKLSLYMVRMDPDCAELLPQVCEVLADPNQAVPDDTCLEKLLDWFTVLTGQVPAQSLLELNPCLISFISSVCRSKSAESSILAFALKLAGLLASSEVAFQLLKERSVVENAFEYRGWIESSHWEDATVRSGWVQGLQNMLKHWPAMQFMLESGLLKAVLHLQSDQSLFVASATNQLLARILTFPTAPEGDLSMEDACMVDEKKEHKISRDHDEWTQGTGEILKLVEESLASNIPFRVHQSLKLIGLSLTHCQPHVREVLWQKTVEAKEVLLRNGHSSLTQPFLEVLRAAVRTFSCTRENSSIVTLIEDMLCSLSPTLAIPFATGIIRLDNCPQVLKDRAAAIILQPLDHITALVGSQQKCSGTLPNSDCEHSVWEEQLSQKSSCISLLCLSLTSTSELLGLEPLRQNICVQSVILSVTTLLKICDGGPIFTSSTSHVSKAFRKLIGCSRVQKCVLDTLAALSHFPGSDVYAEDILSVLLLVLQNPDTDQNVFKKTLQTTLGWLSSCSQSPFMSLFLNKDLFPGMKKRLCDVRWEVRDSSLEFLTHLMLQFQGNPSFCKALSSSGICGFLMALLIDPESYVRASAVYTLGQMVCITCPEKGPTSPLGVQDEIFVRFTDILAQDTEGFARRAVIKVFCSWVRSPPLQPLEKMEKHLSTVLQHGSHDLDWEVKVHTLELAQIVIDQLLESSGHSSCPYNAVPSARNTGADLAESLRKLHRLTIFHTLFSGLFDCDRPVAQQACRILLHLKQVIADNIDDVDKTVLFDLQECKWGEDVLKKHSVATDTRVCVDIVELLQSLDLEGRQQVLDKSSDHLENSPRSLMQDILAAAHTAEENIADCY